ncbi:MAG: PKD domain-containing protein [Verrucomicrobiales bacterium]|nr:PKD domain-containing protein [Verrucomicrobiales bacterium]
MGQGKCSGYANSTWPSVWAANVNAFEVNGHLETGSANEPTELCSAAAAVFESLCPRRSAWSNPCIQRWNPDSRNGGVLITSDYKFYQGGMLMDAIIASGTPTAIAVTGPAPSGANPGILGRTYADIIQDMVDAYAWAQYDGDPGGGWRYEANQYPDNSACQWAAIGMIPAERNWGLTVPQWVKNWNVPWLAASQYNSPGNFYHGALGYYPGYWFPWGPYATTASGMVQMIMDGLGRGATGWPSWDAAETFIRNNFGNTGGATSAIRDYYYALLSFVKSMVLYPYDGDEDPLTPDPTPIKWLRSQTAGVPPLDWYAAEVSQGAPTDGVARTLVNDQSFGAQWGYWSGHNYRGDQYPFETAWAIQMLNRTIVDPRVVAVAKAISNPGVVGELITLDGSDSYQQSPGLIIDSWDWDVDNDGTFDASGPFVTVTFSAIGNYPVKLRVTDNGTPEQSAETIVVVRITEPPVAPTADANGLTLRPQAQPWFLDGRWSRNPDDGQ